MVRRYLAGLPGACAAPMDHAATGQDFSVFLPADQLVQAATFLRGRDWFLEDLAGLHVAEGFEVDYHFAGLGGPERLTLRVVVAGPDPELPTLSAIHPGADWHERETADFFGVRFAGHPNPMPLLLPDDEPTRPLRREPERLRPLAALLPQALFAHHPEEGEGER